MRILLTGSSGGIGWYVHRELEHAGHEVVALGHEWLEATIRGDSRVHDVIRSCDAAVLCAATPFKRDVSLFEQTFGDLTAVTSVLDKLTRKHVVFLSSATVYGASKGVDGWLSEGHADWSSAGSIGRAKLTIENLLSSRSGSGGYTVLRLCNVLSPREPHDRPGHAQVDFYRQIFVEQRQSIEIAHAHALKCWTWVGDVATAVVHAVKSRPHGVYNIGSENPGSVEGLAREMIVAGRRCGELPYEYKPVLVPMLHEGDKHSILPSMNRSRLAGFSACRNFYSAVEAFVKGKAVLAAQAKDKLVKDRAT